MPESSWGSAGSWVPTDPANCDILFLNLVERFPLMLRPFGCDCIGHVTVRGASSIACSDLSFKEAAVSVSFLRPEAGEDVSPESRQTQINQTQPWNALPVYWSLSPAQGSLLCPKEYLGIDLQSNSETGAHLHQSTKNKEGNKTKYFSTNPEILKTLKTSQGDH